MHILIQVICLLLVSYRRTTEAAFLAQDKSVLMQKYQFDNPSFREKRISTLFQDNIRPVVCYNQTNHNNIEENSSFSKNDSYLLQLPIFPLRKRVKFPTDKIVLNLYEPRYIALANRVLEQNERCFGAIYSSHKPQMVSNGGMNPITPIVEKGDVGLIYEVYSSKKKFGSLVAKDRVQLSARGVKRFYVEKVIQNGFDDNKDSESLPYIVVEASLLEDVTSNYQEKQEKLASLLNKYRSELLDLTKDVDMINSELFNESNFIEKTADNEEFTRISEMVTFALSSKLVEVRPAQEMLKLLRMNCTLERFEYVMKHLRIR